MDQVQKELAKDVNDASVRSNVDSAKKRACLQHMDYDNFHQMVLGANLFPIKKGEAHRIYDPNLTGLSQNPQFVLIGSGTANEDVVKATLGINLGEALVEPRNLSELEKFFCNRCHDEMQRYTYLRVIGLNVLLRICRNFEFESELLIAVVRCFQEQVINNLSFNNEEEQGFMLDWLSTVVKQSKDFGFILDFLGDDEREMLVNLVSSFDKVDASDLKKVIQI